VSTTIPVSFARQSRDAENEGDGGNDEEDGEDEEQRTARTRSGMNVGMGQPFRNRGAVG
jgi:hypothetical protein